MFSKHTPPSVTPSVPSQNLPILGQPVQSKEPDVGSQDKELQEVISKIQQLECMLTDAHPGIRTMLAQIHTKLAKIPYISTLLTEQQIETIVRALTNETHVEVMVAKSSKKTGIKGKVSVEDI